MTQQSTRPWVAPSLSHQDNETERVQKVLEKERVEIQGRGYKHGTNMVGGGGMGQEDKNR